MVNFSGFEEKQDASKYDVAVYESLYTEKRLRGPFRYFWLSTAWVYRQGEGRGIERQPPDERIPADTQHCLKLLAIWLGACGSVTSLTGFFSGSQLFGLGFKASLSASFLGTFVGSLVGTFGAVMGVRSGLRSMVGVRYQFGWWPAKFISLLNLLTGVGWAMVSAEFGGQLLSGVSGGSMSDFFGILICFLVTTAVSLFGIPTVSLFDKILVGPVLIAFLLVYICSAPDWDVSHPNASPGSGGIVSWLGMFQSSVGITSTWIGCGDYYIYFPENCTPWKVYVLTLAAMWVPTVFVGVIGVGLSAGAIFGSNQNLNDALNNGGGAELMAESMERWSGGGKFLLVLVFISIIFNLTFTMYSFGLGCQTLGRPLRKVPRFIYTILGCVIFFVLAAVGRSKWVDTVSNFLPMIGYWSMMYGVILLLETLLMRAGRPDYQWDQWDNPHHFPIMWAACFSFGCGIAGAVLGMDQTYYVGRLAHLIGSDGGELGTFLSFGFTGLVYLVTRPIEIHFRGMIT